MKFHRDITGFIFSAGLFSYSQSKISSQEVTESSCILNAEYLVGEYLPVLSSCPQLSVHTKLLSPGKHIA